MLKSTKKSNKIYLDYASATPLDMEVLRVMNMSLKNNFANSSSIHESGLKIKKFLDNARKSVANILGAHANEIIFTSGSTESNNLAILGLINAEEINDFLGPRKGVSQTLKNHSLLPHLVITNIEHASVLELCKYLEKTKRAEVTYVEVEKNGIVNPQKIKKAIKKNTILISVMYANNEIGTIQPIREIAKEIRHFNKLNNKHIAFHTDATQAINYLKINVEKLGVDLFSFNSAKIYGSKGVGVLFKRRNISLDSILKGGEQEFNLRPGTENVPLIIGLARALEITEKIKNQEVKRLTQLQNYFFKKLLNLNSQITINGSLDKRLPNNINITIPKIPSDLLVIELSARGIMASAKSACKSGDGKVSYVIKAINPEISETDGSIRFSLGRDTKKEHIDFTIKSLQEILIKLKKWYN